MHLRYIAALALVANFGLGISTTGPTFAAGSSELMLKYSVAVRKLTMHDMGHSFSELGHLPGSEMVEEATLFVDAFATLADFFPEGSDIEDSRALPAIWEDWDDFTAILGRGTDVAATMLASAEAGDQAAFGAAAKTLGQVCGQCHSSFRGPKP